MTKIREPLHPALEELRARYQMSPREFAGSLKRFAARTTGTLTEDELKRAQAVIHRIWELRLPDNVIPGALDLREHILKLADRLLIGKRRELLEPKLSRAELLKSALKRPVERR
jgi:hypothetical protein